MTQSELRASAIIIVLHVLMLFVGFSILAAVFEFPDVLRESSQYRLSLFRENSAIIIPTYFILAMTGITQIIIAFMVSHVFPQKTLMLGLATLFGILCGVFQVLGFIRWPVLIPYLAEVEGVSSTVVALVEGAFNRYAGMAIGEHLGFLMQAAWTFLLGMVILKQSVFAKSLGWVAIALGLLTLPISLEPLGEIFAPVSSWSTPILGAWLVWLLFIAVSLWRTSPESMRGPKFGWLSLGMGLATWSLLVGPSLLRS